MRTRKDGQLPNKYGAGRIVSKLERDHDVFRARLAAWEQAADDFMVVNWIGVYDREDEPEQTFQRCIEHALDQERDTLRAERAAAQRAYESMLSAHATPEIFKAVQWAVCYKEERAIRDDRERQLLTLRAERDRLQGVIAGLRTYVAVLIRSAPRAQHRCAAELIGARLDRLLAEPPRPEETK